MVSQTTVSPAFCIDKDKIPHISGLNTAYWWEFTASKEAKYKAEGTIWFGGVWFDGIWSIGTWYDGVWAGGSWTNGTWLDGLWVDGQWHMGSWLDGVWVDGQWNNGWWVNGIWLNGLWLDGEISKEIVNGRHKYEKINISPKSYYKPKLTLSLNYAKYI